MPLLRETCTWVGPPANLTSYLPSCQIDLADRPPCFDAAAEQPLLKALGRWRSLRYEANVKPLTAFRMSVIMSPIAAILGVACTLLVTLHLFPEGRAIALLPGLQVASSRRMSARRR
jgi:hypothetical protein